MASVDYQNSILWRGEDPLKQRFKPKYDNSARIERYRPGKAPKWVPKEGQDGNDPKLPDEKETRDTGKRDKRDKRKWTAAAVLEPASNSRLKRLSASEGATETGSERLLRHRTIHEARVLEAAETEKEEKIKEEENGEADADGLKPVAELVLDKTKEEELDDDDLQVLRRERAREVALLRRKEEEEELIKEEQDAAQAEEDEEDESDEESGSDDDPRRPAMLKPVFVSKVCRETVREKEALKREEVEAEQRQKAKLKERKVESKQLLIDEIKHDDEIEREGFNENDASDIELIDDNDEKNEAEEYELWKIRELKRIKRDKEERMVRQKEIEWILKRRAMTEEEREADDRRLDAESSKRDDVKQFGFLQKYYHRGGFFQDKATTGEEPLYLRDYHEPLAEEQYDKKLLPEAMQLRRGQFGKKGQVKHTHLTDVDTTDFQAAWSQHSKQVQRYQEKMAAARGVNAFDRPTSSSRASPG